MEWKGTGDGLEDERSIVVRTFDNGIDAEIACQRLTAEGIDAAVEGNDASGWRGYPLDVTKEFRLVVLGRNALRAAEILAALGI